MWYMKHWISSQNLVTDYKVLFLKKTIVLFRNINKAQKIQFMCFLNFVNSYYCRVHILAARKGSRQGCCVEGKTINIIQLNYSQQTNRQFMRFGENRDLFEWSMRNFHERWRLAKSLQWFRSPFPWSPIINLSVVS